MLRGTLRLLTLTLPSLAILAAPAAQAVYIDSFDVAEYDMTAPVTDGVQGPIPGSDVISNQRIFDILFDTTVQIDVADSNILSASATSLLSFGIEYDLLNPEPDQSNLGLYGDRFVLDVASVDDVQVRITLIDPDSSAFRVIDPTAGANTVLFNTFAGIDFASVNAIRLEFLKTNDSTGAQSIQLNHFSAVPEPGTAGMLGLGLLGLVAASPRRRARA